jgi:hypothetical protein
MPALFPFSFSTYRQQQQRRQIRFASVFHARTSYPSQLVFLLFIRALDRTRTLNISYTPRTHDFLHLFNFLAKGKRSQLVTNSNSTAD